MPNKKSKRNNKTNSDNQSAGDADTNPPVSAPPSGKRGGSGQRSNEAPTNDPSLGFSEGAKFLEQVGLSISGRIEEVPSPMRTEGYFHVVQVAYQELIHVKPEAQDALSFEEFKHICALFLYHRMQLVEFTVTGIKQPARNRTPVPFDVKVFQPIWAFLSEIGVVLDQELSVKYFPVAKMPRSEDQSDPEDIEEMLDCIQYPWGDSWQSARDGRTARIAAAAEVYPERAETLLFADTDAHLTQEEIDILKRKVVQGLSDLKKLRRTWNSDLDGDGTNRGGFEIDDTEWMDNGKEVNIGESMDVNIAGGVVNLQFKADRGFPTTPFRTRDQLDEIYSDMVEEMKELKENKLKYRPRLQTPKTRTFDLGTHEYNGDSGAYGAWLGSDGQLWIDYYRFVDILKPVALFSLSFPKDEKGTYAWLIDRREDESGFFVKLPKRSIATVVWMTGLVFDPGALPQRRTCTWYTETDRANSLIATRLGYIKAAIHSGMPTEVFR